MASWWSPLQQTFSQWSEHKDARLGAALAYYSKRLPELVDKLTPEGRLPTGSVADGLTHSPGSDTSQKLNTRIFTGAEQ
jgi:hypothetical protein